MPGEDQKDTATDIGVNAASANEPNFARVAAGTQTVPVEASGEALFAKDNKKKRQLIARRLQLFHYRLPKNLFYSPVLIKQSTCQKTFASF